MNLYSILTDKNNLTLAIEFYRELGNLIAEPNKTNTIKIWRQSDNISGFDYGNIPRFYQNLPHQIEAIKEIEKWVYSRPETLKQVTELFNKLRERNKDIPKEAIDIIKKWEGFYANAYLCPAKVWTIGYGTTVYLNGTPVKKGDRITETEALELLEIQLIRRYIPPLARIPGWNQMNDKMRAALISFSYNLGPFWYGNSGFRSLTTRLQNKEWTRVAKTLELYRNPGSSFEQGLLNRRRDEGKLWDEGLSELRK